MLWLNAVQVHRLKSILLWWAPLVLVLFRCQWSGKPASEAASGRNWSTDVLLASRPTSSVQVEAGCAITLVFSPGPAPFSLTAFVGGDAARSPSFIDILASSAPQRAPREGARARGGSRVERWS